MASKRKAKRSHTVSRHSAKKKLETKVKKKTPVPKQTSFPQLTKEQFSILSEAPKPSGFKPELPRPPAWGSVRKVIEKEGRGLKAEKKPERELEPAVEESGKIPVKEKLKAPPQWKEMKKAVAKEKRAEAKAGLPEITSEEKKPEPVTGIKPVIEEEIPVKEKLKTPPSWRRIKAEAEKEKLAEEAEKLEVGLAEITMPEAPEIEVEYVKERLEKEQVKKLKVPPSWKKIKKQIEEKAEEVKLPEITAEKKPEIEPEPVREEIEKIPVREELKAPPSWRKIKKTVEEKPELPPEPLPEEGIKEEIPQEQLELPEHWETEFGAEQELPATPIPEDIIRRNTEEWRRGDRIWQDIKGYPKKKREMLTQLVKAVTSKPKRVAGRRPAADVIILEIPNHIPEEDKEAAETVLEKEPLAEPPPPGKTGTEELEETAEEIKPEPAWEEITGAAGGLEETAGEEFIPEQEPAPETAPKKPAGHKDLFEIQPPPSGEKEITAELKKVRAPDSAEILFPEMIKEPSEIKKAVEARPAFMEEPEEETGEELLTEVPEETLIEEKPVFEGRLVELGQKKMAGFGEEEAEPEEIPQKEPPIEVYLSEIQRKEGEIREYEAEIERRKAEVMEQQESLLEQLREKEKKLRKYRREIEGKLKEEKPVEEIKGKKTAKKGVKGKMAKKEIGIKLLTRRKGTGLGFIREKKGAASSETFLVPEKEAKRLPDMLELRKTEHASRERRREELKALLAEARTRINERRMNEALEIIKRIRELMRSAVLDEEDRRTVEYDILALETDLKLARL